MTNVGVIGLGAMGQNHARVYSEIANLVSVVDIDNEILTDISKRYNTEGLNDYHDILDREDLDAVSICTPTSMHFEISNAFIEAGKHVLVEKPICGNINDAKILVENAKKNNVILATGFIERHNPVVGLTKSLIGKRQFGDVISISSRRVSSFPGRIKDVGVILDLGIHDLDVIRYLLDSKVRSVYALAGKTSETEFEDHANILLEFENHVLAFIEVNWLTPMKVRKVSLTCSKNFVEMDYINQSLQISSSTIRKVDTGNLYRIPQEYAERKIEIERMEPLKNELNNFLQAIDTGKGLLVSGEESIMTLEIAHAAMLSAKEGRKVSI